MTEHARQPAERSRPHRLCVRPGFGCLPGVDGPGRAGLALCLRALCRRAHAGGARHVAASRRPLETVSGLGSHLYPSAGCRCRAHRLRISRLPARDPRPAGPQRRIARARSRAAGKAQRGSLRRSPGLRRCDLVDSGIAQPARQLICCSRSRTGPARSFRSSPALFLRFTSFLRARPRIAGFFRFCRRSPANGSTKRCSARPSACRRGCSGRSASC